MDEGDFWEQQVLDHDLRRVLMGTEFGSMVEADWLLTRAAVEARTSRRLDSMVAPWKKIWATVDKKEVAERGG